MLVPLDCAGIYSIYLTAIIILGHLAATLLGCLNDTSTMIP